MLVHTYTPEEQRDLGQRLSALRTEKIGARRSPCLKVRSKTVRNPFYHIYIASRQEPSTFELHQMAFIAANGYLPSYNVSDKKKMNLSHMCHLHETNRTKSHRVTCVQSKHIILESIKLNASRGKCLRQLRKEAAKWRRKRNKRFTGRKLFTNCCPSKHRPGCFISVGTA